MTPAAVSTLVCPACRWPLEFDGRLAGGKLDSGALRCGRGWPGRDGLPRLIDEDGVRRADRFMRVLYDWLAPLGDPLTRALFPPLRGISERHAASRGDAHRARGLSGIRHSALAYRPVVCVVNSSEGVSTTRLRVLPSLVRAQRGRPG